MPPGDAADTRYPCPCCGHLVFAEGPGSYDICKICFWEDDNVQLRWPTVDGGANTVSLVEAQWAYGQLGVSEPKYLGSVRPPERDELLDGGWRPINLVLDNIEPRDSDDAPWPDDRTALYWWRPTYWRRTTLAPPQ